MFTKPTDTNKAAIFSVLVLLMALVAALLIRFLDLGPNLGMWILWLCYSYSGCIDHAASANQGW
jgi:hypothetical protein